MPVVDISRPLCQRGPPFLSCCGLVPIYPCLVNPSSRLGKNNRRVGNITQGSEKQGTLLPTTCAVSLVVSLSFVRCGLVLAALPPLSLSLVEEVWCLEVTVRVSDMWVAQTPMSSACGPPFHPPSGRTWPSGHGPPQMGSMLPESLLSQIGWCTSFRSRYGYGALSSPPGLSSHSRSSRTVAHLRSLAGFSFSSPLRCPSGSLNVTRGRFLVLVLPVWPPSFKGVAIWASYVGPSSQPTATRLFAGLSPGRSYASSEGPYHFYLVVLFSLSDLSVCCVAVTSVS